MPHNPPGSCAAFCLPQRQCADVNANAPEVARSGYLRSQCSPMTIHWPRKTAGNPLPLWIIHCLDVPQNSVTVLTDDPPSRAAAEGSLRESSPGGRCRIAGTRRPKILSPSVAQVRFTLLPSHHQTFRQRVGPVYIRVTHAASWRSGIRQQPHTLPTHLDLETGVPED